MLRRELPAFLVVGGTTVLVDYLSYRMLSFAGMQPVALAKALGFIAGTLFAYLANRYVTFLAHRQPVLGTLWRFGILYTLTLAVNVLLNDWLLRVLPPLAGPVTVAFVGATAASAALNFIGMKHFVFAIGRIKEAA